MHRRPSLVLVALVLLSGCVAQAGRDDAPAEPIAGGAPDDLYRDFLDGKFDGAGHPVGATVLEAGEGCAAGTGEASKEGGWRLVPGAHAAGLACAGTTRRLGRGLHTVNVRAALDADAVCDADCDPSAAFVVRVLDASGEPLAEESFDAKRFVTPREWQNLALRFRVREAAELRVEVEWPGEVPVRLEYVEVFRQDRQLVLSPPSGVLADAADFRIELVDPPDDALPRVRCNDEDVTPRLEALLASGEATEERTDFRRIFTAPADTLFEGCGPDRAVVVEVGETWVRATSEARYLSAAPACDSPSN